MFVGQKVGEFKYSTGIQRISGNRAIETIFEGDIFHEVELIKQAQDDINQKFAQFSQKYGIKKDQPSSVEAKVASSSDHLSDLQRFKSTLKLAVEDTNFSVIDNVPLRRQDHKTSLSSSTESEVQVSLKDL